MATRKKIRIGPKPKPQRDGPPRKGAPVGNQFWKLRTKHGRNSIFTPDELAAAIEEYFVVTSQRTWDREDWVGKDAIPVIRKVHAPFTISSLCIFLDVSRDAWIVWRKSKDFFNIIARAEEVIFTQKFEGAVVGVYKENIIARDLHLRENYDHNIEERDRVADVFPDSLDLDPPTQEG